jgi:hypothetical protein
MQRQMDGQGDFNKILNGDTNASKTTVLGRMSYNIQLKCLD